MLLKAIGKMKISIVGTRMIAITIQQY